jgi:hypothetical protein
MEVERELAQVRRGPDVIDGRAALEGVLQELQAVVRIGRGRVVDAERLELARSRDARRHGTSLTDHRLGRVVR